MKISKPHTSLPINRTRRPTSLGHRHWANTCLKVLRATASPLLPTGNLGVVCIIKKGGGDTGIDTGHGHVRKLGPRLYPALRLWPSAANAHAVRWFPPRSAVATTAAAIGTAAAATATAAAATFVGLAVVRRCCAVDVPVLSHCSDFVGSHLLPRLCTLRQGYRPPLLHPTGLLQSRLADLRPPPAEATPFVRETIPLPALSTPPATRCCPDLVPAGLVSIAA